jgi:hypothetical protein
MHVAAHEDFAWHKIVRRTYDLVNKHEMVQEYIHALYASRSRSLSRDIYSSNASWRNMNIICVLCVLRVYVFYAFYAFYAWGTISCNQGPRAGWSTDAMSSKYRASQDAGYCSHYFWFFLSKMIQSDTIFDILLWEFIHAPWQRWVSRPAGWQSYTRSQKTYFRNIQRRKMNNQSYGHGHDHGTDIEYLF